MLSLTTRIQEEIKYNEKDPRIRGKSQNKSKPPLKATPTTTIQPNPSKDGPRPPNTENKPKRKPENRPWRPKGPKEYASRKNNKGERIYFIYRDTKHLASFHKKDDKGDAEKKPGVYAIKTPSGRKKGQERIAEKA